MIVIKYTENYGPEEVVNYYNYIKTLFPEEECLVIPQDWDILFNYSTAELYIFMDYIKEIIRKKEIANGEY